MRSPRECRCKLPGEKESTDKDPNIEADVVEGGQKHQKDGGEDAASHGDDDQFGGQEHSGEEGTSQPAQAHPWAVEGVCQSSPDKSCISISSLCHKILNLWVSSCKGPHMENVVAIDWNTLIRAPENAKNCIARNRNILFLHQDSFWGPESLCFVLVFSS